MTKQEVKQLIFDKSGVDTNSRMMKASMKDYIQFYISFKTQPTFSFCDEFQMEAKQMFAGTKKVYVSRNSIEIHKSLITHD